MDDNMISLLFDATKNYKITSAHLQHWLPQSNYTYCDPRPDYGLLFVINGKIVFASHLSTIVANAGDIIFLPKGSRYKAVINSEYGEVDDYLINFSCDIEPNDAIPNTPFKILHTAKHRYIDMFSRLIEAKFNNTLDSFAAKSDFYILIDNILKDCKNVSITPTDAIIKKAEQLLKSENDMSIKEIAKECCVSESGLRNLFSKSLGKSPSQYRIDSKITKAKYLLESTDMSLSDIANTLKFYDEAYFCKIFRSRVGCTPKKYAANKRI